MNTMNVRRQLIQDLQLGDVLCKDAGEVEVTGMVAVERFACRVTGIWISGDLKDQACTSCHDREDDVLVLVGPTTDVNSSFARHEAMINSIDAQFKLFNTNLPMLVRGILEGELASDTGMFEGPVVAWISKEVNEQLGSHELDEEEVGKIVHAKLREIVLG